MDEFVGCKLWVEGDFRLVIDSLQQEQQRHMANNFLLDMANMLQLLPGMKISHIHKEGNQCSDWVANVALKRRRDFWFDDDVPLEFLLLVQADA